MKVRLPNDVTYELDLSLTYEQRVDFVNHILQSCLSTIDSQWENRKMQVLLDILGGYLFYGKAVDEKKEEYSILNHSQMKRRNDIEIPVNFAQHDSGNFEDLFDYLSKAKKHKPKGKKAINKYKLSTTHKLTTLKIPPEARGNRKIPLENTITTHCFEVIDNKITYNNDMKYMAIDVFTNGDLELPYINPSLPYSYSWAVVNCYNEFTFNNQLFKIQDENYLYDRVLCYHQSGNNYFFDPKINLISSSITTEYNL